jgi:hypothetical protein
MNEGPKIETGNLYKITYLAQSGNGRWQRKVMTAVYLGYNPRGETLAFSLRPVAGTTELSARNNPVESVELVVENVARKYRDGARDPALPAKRPISLGYVDKPEGK